MVSRQINICKSYNLDYNKLIHNTTLTSNLHTYSNQSSSLLFSFFATPFPFPSLGFNSVIPIFLKFHVRADEALIPGKSLDEYTLNGSEKISAKMGCGLPVSCARPQSSRRNLRRYTPAVRTERSANTKNVAGGGLVV
jgi:hypothetical protein